MKYFCINNPMYKHGMSGTKLYEVWQSMKKRCYGIYNISYKNYGGRGIRVCNEWLNDFLFFFNWAVNNGYKEGLTLDRINNDGNYCPENCRWATKQIQALNRRQKKNKLNEKNIKYIEKTKMYNVSFKRNNKSRHLGNFSNLKEAIVNRDNYLLNEKLT